MADSDRTPVCDCGYRCEGDTVLDRVRDAQRHAWQAHGIEVSADQILKEGHAT